MRLKSVIAFWILTSAVAVSMYNVQLVKANGPVTLLTGLEYPKGLWVKNNRVYLTETNGRNTGYGGKICLDLYDAATGQKSLLVDDPVCSDAVVVASDNQIYLTSYLGSVPGDSGQVTVVNPATNIEAFLLDIEIASRDMFIDADDNILIIGASDTAGAKSIYQLLSENYTSPVVLKTGLGRTWCISKFGEDTYFSDLSAIKRFNDTVGSIETFLSKSVMSLSASSDYIYYADYFGNTIGRIHIQTKSDQTLVSGLNGPITVRYDDVQDRLYFLEVGTSAGQYKDGTLKVIEHVQGTRFHHGDVVLVDNDVITIPGTLNINGSIIVEENATLIFRNALINFTQASPDQFNMTFQSPASGHPRFTVENSSIASNGYLMKNWFKGNSSASIVGLLTLHPNYIYVREEANVSITNSTVNTIWNVGAGSYIDISDSSIGGLYAYSTSNTSVHNSLCTYSLIRDNSTVSIADSVDGQLHIVLYSANCSASELLPGHFDYWDFQSDNPVVLAYNGQAPNIILVNTSVDSWSFTSNGFSNTSVTKSQLLHFTTNNNAVGHISDSVLDQSLSWADSTIWLINSTAGSIDIRERSRVYIGWHLDVHVVDSLGQNVPSANVTAAYPDATTAQFKLTDADGWATLDLAEKIMNLTMEYPIGNYTVEATYAVHSDATSVNMTNNTEVALQLVDFIIPEFPVLLVLPLFMLATLLAAIVYRRKHSM